MSQLQYNPVHVIIDSGGGTGGGDVTIKAIDPGVKMPITIDVADINDDIPVVIANQVEVKLMTIDPTIKVPVVCLEDYKLVRTEDTGTVVYNCYVKMGTAKWYLWKYTYDATGGTFLYARGDSAFLTTWNDRANPAHYAELDTLTGF